MLKTYVTLIRWDEAWIPVMAYSKDILGLPKEFQPQFFKNTEN